MAAQDAVRRGNLEATALEAHDLSQAALTALLGALDPLFGQRRDLYGKLAYAQLDTTREEIRRKVGALDKQILTKLGDAFDASGKLKDARADMELVAAYRGQLKLIDGGLIDG